MSVQLEQLRKRLSEQRRSLSEREQQQAGAALLQQLMQQPDLQQASHVALYAADDGEIDPSKLVNYFHSQQKTVYYPIVIARQMMFAPCGEHTPWQANRFGILEPDVVTTQYVTADQLELIFVPLLGFDRMGNRLGRGGGYYDRCLAVDSRPTCVGLAHAFQELAHLEPAAWDIPLDAILTDQEYIPKANYM